MEFGNYENCFEIVKSRASRTLGTIFFVLTFLKLALTALVTLFFSFLEMNEEMKG